MPARALSYLGTSGSRFAPARMLRLLLLLNAAAAAAARGSTCGSPTLLHGEARLVAAPARPAWLELDRAALHGAGHASLRLEACAGDAGRAGGGGGVATSVEVFSGPNCDTLERLATLALRCGHWMAISLHLEESDRALLRVEAQGGDGEVALRGGLVAPGGELDDGMEQVTVRKVDSEQLVHLPIRELPRLAVRAEADESPLGGDWAEGEAAQEAVSSIIIDGRQAMSSLVHRADAPEAYGLEPNRRLQQGPPKPQHGDRVVTSLAELQAGLQGTMPTSLQIVGRIPLEGSQVVIGAGQAVTMWGNGAAELDADLQSRVLWVRH
jgi:hypothetical protein